MIQLIVIQLVDHLVKTFNIEIAVLLYMKAIFFNVCPDPWKVKILNWRRALSYEGSTWMQPHGKNAAAKPQPDIILNRGI